MKTSRMLPLVALGVLALLALVVGGTGKKEQLATPAPVLPEIPQPPSPAPDEDSPADTVKALTAQVREMNARLATWDKQAERLLGMREGLETDLRSRITSDLLAQRDKEREQIIQQMQKERQMMLEKLAELERQLDEQKKKSPYQYPPSVDGLPTGFGLTEHETAEAAALEAPVTDLVVWVEPEDGKPAPIESGQSPRLLKTSVSSTAQKMDPPAPAVQKEETEKPVYTIPENATLIGATAFTALVGRIPVNGKITDPFPFKVLVGRDNIAANGLYLPGVAGMVFSGIASGDFGLKCVRGTLTSATFVFDDGTIRTVKGDSMNPLGTLSDDQGIPCIAGQLITNAPAYLTQKILVSSAEGVAKAAAAAQTSRTVTRDGGSITTVTGDMEDYLIGEATSGAAREVRNWLDARQGQSFDAIFAPPGIKVALHITRQMDIDYEVNGRKLSHVMGEEHRYESALP